jgi:transcriptional regulator with XRE-family HTH domain
MGDSTAFFRLDLGSEAMPRRTVVADPGFGRRLKELREQSGMSLRRLGQKIHCSHGYLWDLESGTKRPSVSVAALLDAALGAGGQLSALVYDVSADSQERPVGIEHGAHATPAGLEFAPDWRH